MSVDLQEPTPVATGVLTDARDRAIDALVAGAVVAPGPDGTELATWPTWELDSQGRPTRVTGGRRSLYDGDAGIAYALTELGRLTGRQDTLAIAAAGRRLVYRSDPRTDPDPSLLSGTAGAALLPGARGSTQAMIPAGADLTAGAAGFALHTEDPIAARAAVERIAGLSRIDPIGRCWPDGAEPALCGLAHGASGIALALTEVGYRFAGTDPRLADRALTLADDALAWESTWFDPVRGGWPDLRTEEETYPDLWCHGSAGIAVARLRILELTADGPVPPWPTETVRAEAETAVACCGRALAAATEQVLSNGWDTVPAGLTLCHGLAGPLEALLAAYRVWRAPEHLQAAREFAGLLVDALPEDPWQWPNGLPGSPAGVAGLFVGFAGTALTLARLSDPDAGAASAARFEPLPAG